MEQHCHLVALAGIPARESCISSRWTGRLSRVSVVAISVNAIRKHLYLESTCIYTLSFSGES